MTLSKQQAICLKLAQWLGWDARIGESGCGYYVCIDARKEFVQFNPFFATTEGRAQFAECWDKATDVFWAVTVDKDNAFIMQSDDDHYLVPIVGNKFAATLEAIFYAIGGTAGEWE